MKILLIRFSALGDVAMLAPVLRLYAQEQAPFLINTSRGAVVKTADLAEAIKKGMIKGAALDVLEYEEMTQDGLDTSHPDLQYLLTCPNVVFTPHVGGWTVESKYKLAKVLADKMLTCLC